MSRRGGRTRIAAVVAIAALALGCATPAPTPAASALAPSPSPASPSPSASASIGPTAPAGPTLGDPGVLAVTLPDGWRVARPPLDDLPALVGLIGFVALTADGATAWAIAAEDPPAVVVISEQEAKPGLTADGIAGALYTAAADINAGRFPAVERIESAAGFATSISGSHSYQNQTGSGPPVLETDEVTAVYGVGERIVTVRMVVAAGTLDQRADEFRAVVASAVSAAAGDSPASVTFGCDTVVEADPAADPVLGQMAQDGGNLHLEVGAAATYPACPPASGSHYPQPAAPVLPRAYGPGEAIAPQHWLHNLEHGDVVVLYQCPEDDCTQVATDLAAIIGGLPPSALCGRPASALAARFDEMAAPVALLSWGRIRFLDGPDPAVISAFHEATVDRGPERLCRAAVDAASSPAP